MITSSTLDGHPTGFGSPPRRSADRSPSSTACRGRSDTTWPVTDSARPPCAGLLTGPSWPALARTGWRSIWDAVTGTERFRVEGGSAWVERVAWSPSGDVLATAAGKSLRFWDTAGRLLMAAPQHPSTIADIRWRPRWHELASAAYGQLAIWKHDKAEAISAFEWKGSMLTLAWSPDGRYIATGDQDSTLHFWIVKTGEDLMMYGYPTKVRELSWDSVGRYLATGGGPQVTVWDCSGKGPEGARRFRSIDDVR